jgi:hypothetical protein
MPTKDDALPRSWRRANSSRVRKATQNEDRAKTQEKPNLAREENIRAIYDDIEEQFDRSFEDFE